jgi:hypothetical protein
MPLLAPMPPSTASTACPMCTRSRSTSPIGPPCRKLLGRMQKLAADPKRVTKAVDHALTSRPKPRYLLDIVSRAQKAVVAITPTAVNDAVLAAATTSK